MKNSLLIAIRVKLKSIPFLKLMVLRSRAFAKLLEINITNFFFFVIKSKVRPVSNQFGYDRGLPIDRFYIEKFLDLNKKRIFGYGLEFGDDRYLSRYPKVTKYDVISVVKNHPAVNLVGDITQNNFLVENTYDTIICTQVLPHIYDYDSAVRNMYKSLVVGGVCLVTAPCINRISEVDRNITGDFWRFTEDSLLRIFSRYFRDVELISLGNVYSATNFLYGYSVEDVSIVKLNMIDINYPVIIGVRAIK